MSRRGLAGAYDLLARFVGYAVDHGAACAGHAFWQRPHGVVEGRLFNPISFGADEIFLLRTLPFRRPTYKLVQLGDLAKIHAV